MKYALYRFTSGNIYLTKGTPPINMQCIYRSQYSDPISPGFYIHPGAGVKLLKESNTVEELYEEATLYAVMQ